MLLALLVPLTLVAACDKVPLLAPTGTTITIIPTAATVANNSQMTIVATVIEHGTSSGGSGTSTSTTSSGGTPVQNGTVVSFTTTLGHIEPAEARTNNGQVAVTLFTDNNSGTPTITAYSGGASATNSTIKIGTATVKTVTLSAQPATLGSSGGTTTLTAIVVNDQGGGVPGVPVTFSTDNGTLSPATATTDANGNATTTLSTTKTAKVTATSGSVATASALTVTVNPVSLSGFSASPTAASAGVPITFTVTPATGATIANVRVSYGDGQSDTLGSIGSAQTISHAYASAGQYTATATATDTAGGTGSLSTSVIIGSLPVTLTASPASPTVGSPVTLTVGGIGSAQVQQYKWTFDDGTGSLTTTSPQLPHTFVTRGLKNVRVDVIGIGGGTIGSAALQLDVQ
jgi:adhesin/invasin